MTPYDALCKMIDGTKEVLNEYAELPDTGVYKDAEAIIEHLTAAKTLIEKIVESNEPY